MRIQFNQRYVTSLIADNDLHAGGIFFSTIYVQYLVFLADGTVIWSKKLVDAFRPLDDADIEDIQNFRKEGKHCINKRGYIECIFEDISVKLTGIVNDELDILVVIGYNSQLHCQWDEIYRIEMEEKEETQRPQKRWWWFGHKEK